MASAPLDVLYRDDYYAAVHKPAGLTVHRSRQCPDADAALQRVRDQFSRQMFPVHRLDRATSGVLVFAFSSGAAGRLCEQFRTHAIDKTYLAVVRGYADADGVIDYALRVSPDKPLQTAVTRYRRLASVELPFPVGPYQTARYSLVAVRIDTGRHHQIRKHFRHLRHPVIGDTAHGDSAHNRLFRAEFKMNRLLLVAVRLAFTHPYTQEPVDIRTSPDPGVAALLERFGWDVPGAVVCGRW